MKRVALVAHDGRKQEMLEWVKYNWKTLSKCHLYATGTTGKLINDLKFDYEFDEYGHTIKETIQPFMGTVERLLSGPLGGDQQIGAMIAEGKIDVLIFFCDNLITQGHQQDVGALSRLAALYNIAFATNRTTADMILTSPLFNDENYERIIPTCIEKYVNRSL